jgi:hypothetical protein
VKIEKNMSSLITSAVMIVVVAIVLSQSTPVYTGNHADDDEAASSAVSAFAETDAGAGNPDVIYVQPAKEISATPRELDLVMGQTVEPEAFIADLQGDSVVTIGYAALPDFALLGRQEVYITLSDEAGNETVLTALLNIVRDDVPPVIEGVQDLAVMLWETVAYRKGVTATDNIDANVELTIDTSAVNLGKAGEYPVTYTAVDSSGNVAEAYITLVVSNIDPNTVHEMADSILKRIITDDMSQKEKAYMIYRYVQKNVTYGSAGDRTNAYTGAYEGLQKKVGDCFVFATTSEILLTRAGIDNMLITRMGGVTRHWWNLVNVGEGWYHFDTCPNTDFLGDFRFMFSEDDAVMMTEVCAYRIPNYYVYDKELYPEVEQVRPGEEIEVE